MRCLLVGRGLAPAVKKDKSFVFGGTKAPPYDVCANSKQTDKSKFEATFYKEKAPLREPLVLEYNGRVGSCRLADGVYDADA